MAIFYFHVSDGRTTFRDADGLEYFDFNSARSQANRLARGLSEKSGFSGFHVAVHDELDRELIRVSVPESLGEVNAFAASAGQHLSF